MFLYISKIFTIIASGIGISFSLVSFFLYRNTSSEKLVSPTEIQMYMRKYNIYDIQNLPQDNHNDNEPKPNQKNPNQNQQSLPPSPLPNFSPLQSSANSAFPAPLKSAAVVFGAVPACPS